MQDWKLLLKGKTIDFMIITGIAILFLSIIAMNVKVIFQLTSNQTEEIGRMQLESIRNDLESKILDSENATRQLADEAEKLIAAGISQEDLTKYFYQKKAEEIAIFNGVCFNTYIANKSFTIIPDFNFPETYHARERLWYIGAAENPGEIYITEPYIDAYTGNICFTMSQMLPDNETVVALDFTFADLQESILKMTAGSNRTALIVGKNGMIIGYTDMSLVGEKISERLPSYINILETVVKNPANESFETEINGDSSTIFSSKTKNGWYMIVSVDTLTLYKDSYYQTFMTILIGLVMLVVIIFFYLNSIKNRMQTEKALRAKEDFLSNLSKELRSPLQKILQLSKVETLESTDKPAEMAAQVRESALKLSDMIDNLFSFSNIVSDNSGVVSDTKNSSNREVFDVSNSARFGIIAVVIAVIIVSMFFCVQTTLNWGNTKMNREVDIYEYQLSTWLERQKSILNSFVNIIRANPEALEDYNGAVKFLNDLAVNYKDISVCYIANPYKENSVIMNNGWKPPADIRPETRQWYIDTVNSDEGFNITAPYFDVQTGLYCITLSQIVHSKTGEFLGVFAIDFFLDKLIHILDASYTYNSYAFLVDKNGIIISHPNINYQMNTKGSTKISDTEYYDAYQRVDEVFIVNDYNGNRMACLAKKNETSNFTVIVAQSWWNTYGYIFFLGIIFIVLLGICVGIVGTLINRLFRWQDSINRQLKAISNTAVAASAAKSQFLAQMSHEIRTPINAVLGMNEMILRESKNPAILDYSANIQSAGRTLLTLINSILDFSKIEDGKMEIVPVRYETVILIEDLENMISEKAKKKGLLFKTEIDSALPRSLYGDDVRIRQIITNLLTNAVKYTHEGVVKLKVGGREIDADTFELQVQVSDTGIGIRSEDIGKLFKSFIRLDEERNRNIEGTGLGIAIVQKLLAMMNSTLKVESIYGKGSTFSFNLIQKIIEKSPIGNYEEQKTKQIKTPENKYLVAAGAKILAVDDNNMNLKVISGLLKRNGIVPDVAESGQQCIEMAQKKFYHIIFLDNMMPVMNGVETLKTMKREKILSDKTSVIMLTASAIAGMREIYLREGFNDYLSKPIEVSELELMLEKHLPPEIVSFKVEEQEEISEPENISNDAGEINTETGLEYSAGMIELYKDVLETFYNLKDEKKQKLQESFKAGDWKNYTVYVHALKSNAQSIGAEKTFNAARELELAGKKITAENSSESEKKSSVEYIKENHAALLKMYDKLADEAKKIAKNLEI